MHILELESFNLDQHTHWPGLERRLGQWVVQQRVPMRLLAYSRPFQMAPAIRRVQVRLRGLDPLVSVVEPLRAAVAGLLSDTPGAMHPAEVVEELPAQTQDVFAAWARTAMPGSGITQLPWAVSDTLWEQCVQALDQHIWARPWLMAQLRFYEDLGRHHLWSTSYYLVVWSNGPVAPLLATLRQATGRAVTVRNELPAAVSGAYDVDEVNARLVPVTAGQPYLTCLHTLQTDGVWTAALTHSLLDDEGDVTLAIDMLPLDREWVIKETRQAHNAAQRRAQAKADDTHAIQVVTDARRVLTEVGVQQQNLVKCHVTALLSADSPAALDTRVATFRQRTGLALTFGSTAGTQGELIHCFSTRAARHITAPIERWAAPTLTQGVGCLFGAIGYKRAAGTDGILLGLDARRRAPLFFNFFGDASTGNQLSHMLAFGIPGAGKTWWMNEMTIRAALEGWRVIWIDAFSNAKRLKRALGTGCQVSAFDFDAGLNVLEVVMDRGSQSSWLPAQVEYALGQIALLLGTEGRNQKGQKCILPKVFSIGQRGATDLALTRLYGRLPAGDLSREAMPRLSDLITELDQLDTVNATAVADEIQELLYGTTDRQASDMTSAGKRFNVPSRVSWSFSGDVNCLDFSAIAKDAIHLLPFYYSQAFGAVNRFARSTDRDLTQATLLICDEFGWAAQIEAVETMAFEISKTARKYRIGQVLADQHPATVLATPMGQNIFGQARGTFMFKLDGLAAQQLREAKPHLTQAHAEFITSATTGYCLADIDGDVYEMLCEANPREYNALKGS